MFIFFCLFRMYAFLFHIYRKIRKISTGVIFFKGPFWEAYFWRGLSTEGNLRFEIDLASLIVGSKFTVFALFYFAFEGNSPSTSPRGAYIWTGNLTEGFLRHKFGGLIFGGAYFRNFTVIFHVDILFFVFSQPLPRHLHFSNGPFVRLPGESTHSHAEFSTSWFLK